MHSTTSRASQNRVQEVSEITTGLKALAKELNVPDIALSQLSRNVDNRDERRPQLSDLRESGSIEQDADVVLFLYREEYYLKGREPVPGTDARFKWEAEIDTARGKAEIIIGKQRHGPTGTVNASFQAEVTRFADLSIGEMTVRSRNRKSSPWSLIATARTCGLGLRGSLRPQSGRRRIKSLLL